MQLRTASAVLRPFDFAESAQSARQHKAWGVSPRESVVKFYEAQEVGDSLTADVSIRISDDFAATLARSRGLNPIVGSNLGLTPQALCFRPLRGLWITASASKLTL